MLGGAVEEDASPDPVTPAKGGASEGEKLGA
jgi:hypothetical protein